MRIMYLGDIHGNFNLIGQYIDRFGIKDTHIIQVGDFGVGFKSLIKEKRELELYHPKLVKNNVIVHAIRGNHDFPRYFENDPFEFSNIRLIKDYTVLNLEGNNILCIGGAISVDRRLRMTKHQKEGNFDIRTGSEGWWPDETFNLDLDRLNKFRDIDIMVTHTAPDYCFPDNCTGLGPFVNGLIKQTGDEELRLDLLDERRHLTLAFQAVKEHNDIKHHYYGHFHRNETTNIYGTKHRLLGVGELFEERKETLF
jgi:predicted phosphodiesterase